MKDTLKRIFSPTPCRECKSYDCPEKDGVNASERFAAGVAVTPISLILEYIAVNGMGNFL